MKTNTKFLITAFSNMKCNWKQSIARFSFCFIFFLFLSLHSFAQLREGEFTILNGYASAIIQSSDKGYAMAGSTGSELNIVKLDSTGKQKWNEVIAGCVGEAIIQAKDGGFAITGYSTTYGAGGEDVYVAKVDSSGNLLWTKTIGGPDDDWGNAITQTKDGGLAITGGTKSFGGGVPSLADIYVIKLDSAGNKKWTKTIEGPWGSDDDGKSIIQTKDGGYAITGLVLGNAGWDKVFVFKLDSVGNLLWSEAIGGTVEEYGESIVETNDSGYAIVGQTVSFGPGAGMYLLKLNSKGTLSWTKTIGDSTVGYSIVQTKDNGFAMAGLYNDSGFVCKTDSTGKFLWFTMSKGNLLYSIDKTKDGGYAAAGNNSSGIFFLKLDSTGNSCDIVRHSMKIDSGGTVTNGGTITSSNGGIMGSGGTVSSGGTTSVICEVTAIEDLNPELKEIVAYPNPSVGKFTFQLVINNEKVVMDIYNELGEKICSKFSIPIAIGINSQFSIDLSSEPSGIYLYRISTEKGKLAGTGKLIIQK